MFRIIFISLICTTLWACTTVQFSPVNLNQNAIPVAKATEVQVYSSKDSQKFSAQAYKEIGVLHYKRASELSVVIAALKEQAAAQGGNAIIDIKVIAGGVVGTLVLIEE